MGHNLYGERLFLKGEPAWHSLGTVAAKNWVGTPRNAIILANCDYEVGKLPVTVDLPNGQKVATDRVALVRMPHHADAEYAVLGFATPRYTPLQNLEVGVILEELARQFPVETVGALGQGETLFVTLRLGKFALNGVDEVETFLAVTNSHDGNSALRIMIVSVRIVCQNTLIMATNSALISTKIPHLSTVRDDADFHVRLLGSVVRGQQRVQREYEALATRRITAEEAYGIFAAAYPDPTPSRKSLLANTVINDAALAAMVNDDRTVSDKLLADVSRNGDKYAVAAARVAALREEAANLYIKTSAITPAIGGTAWAAYNGVTELESWRGGTQKKVSQSIVFGDRAQSMGRAYGAAMALIPAKR